MSSAHEIYARLLNSSDGNVHLVLAELFRLVYNRGVRKSEWGSLRKLIRIYGAEVVYWATLHSANANSSGNVFSYISKVCIGILNEKSEKSVTVDCRLEEDTKSLLKSFRDYVQPDWSEIVGATCH